MGETADTLRTYDPYEGDPDELPDTVSVLPTGAEAVAADDEVDDSTREIRAEIEQTRTEMSSTIDAIQAKLNPQNMIEEAKDTVREATIGRVEQMVNDVSDTAKDTGTNIVDMVKQNPIPAALVGLGIGWLLTRNSGSSSGGRMPMRSQSYDWNPPPPVTGIGRSATSAPDWGGYPSVPVRYYPSYGDGNNGQQSQNPIGQVVDTIRQNPLPAALVGLGVGMMMMKNGNNSGANGAMRQPMSYQPSPVDQVRDTAGQVVDQVQYKAGRVAEQAQDTAGQLAETAQDTVSQVGDTAGQIASQVGDTAGQIVSQVGDTAGQVAQQAQQTAGQVAYQAQDTLSVILDRIRANPIPALAAGLSIGWLVMNSPSQPRANQLLDQASSRVGDTLGQAQDTVGEVASQAQEQAYQAQTQLQRMMQDNPLALALVAAAAGAVVGLAIPETPQEHQLMGEARDSLLSRAQTAAQDTMQKVQSVAAEAQNTIREEAGNQGLTPQADQSQAQQSQQYQPSM